jgi:signal peptidase I
MDLVADILRSFGMVRLQVRGSSMFPSLLPGDVLTVSAKKTESVERGDLVLCARDGFFVVHRVVGKVNISGEAHVVTRGDALPIADAPVLQSELLGRITVVERGAKRWRPRSRVTPLARLTGLAALRAYKSLIVLLPWRPLRYYFQSIALGILRTISTGEPA